jgi:hypothetical protein
MRHRIITLACALAVFATWVGQAAAGGGTGWVP